MGVEYLTLWGFDPKTTQAVVSHYTDYAIPTHHLFSSTEGQLIPLTIKRRTHLKSSKQAHKNTGFKMLD
jgi:hypothetical protein